MALIGLRDWGSPSGGSRSVHLRRGEEDEEEVDRQQPKGWARRMRSADSLGVRTVKGELALYIEPHSPTKNPVLCLPPPKTLLYATPNCKATLALVFLCYWRLGG